jgi:hypothetical protein
MKHLAAACMDLPSKAQAALYLAQNGIDICALCDRFASLLMNYRYKFGIHATMLASAPVERMNVERSLVTSLLRFTWTNPLLESANRNDASDQYCDAPWRYFNKFGQIYGLNLSPLPEFMPIPAEPAKSLESLRK